jgi:hypothetical protein
VGVVEVLEQMVVTPQHILAKDTAGGVGMLRCELHGGVIAEQVFNWNGGQSVRVLAPETVVTVLDIARLFLCEIVINRHILHPQQQTVGCAPVCYTLSPAVSAVSYRGRKCLSNTKIAGCRTVVSEHVPYGCAKCLERNETKICIGTHSLVIEF